MPDGIILCIIFPTVEHSAGSFSQLNRLLSILLTFFLVPTGFFFEHSFFRLGLQENGLRIFFSDLRLFPEDFDLNFAILNFNRLLTWNATSALRVRCGRGA